MSAVYLCNQRMFSPPRATDATLRLDKPAFVGRPLRLVFFDEIPEGNFLYDGWMKHLRQNDEIVQVGDFVAPGKPEEMWLRDRYLVVELRPHGDDGRVARSSSERLAQ